MKKALLLVDPQCDFINGSLPVPGAEAAMNALGRWLAQEAGRYCLKLVTCDHHPHDHCSFVTNGGRWPVHCQKQTVGAAIWPALVPALYADGQTVVLHKGDDPDTEEYSIFRNARSAKKLAALLDGCEEIDICGLAGDICVLDTLRDGIELLGAGRFRVLAEFAPSLDGGAALADFCAANGISRRSGL